MGIVIDFPKNGKEMSVTAADYWGGPVSRSEFQGVQDRNAEILNQLAALVMGGEGRVGMAVQVGSLMMTIGFVLERLGVTPEELAAWIEKKQKGMAIPTRPSTENLEK